MNDQRIVIFGIIGTAVTADTIKLQLDQFDQARPLILEINSEGGSVQEAAAIYNMLRMWPGGVTVEIVGWALSSATFISMAGRHIRMHESSLLMVHAPWVNTSGNAESLRSSADLLDQVSETMLLAYSRSGQPERVIRSWLDGQDHWLTAEQALAVGLVDEVIPAAAQAAARVNVKACRHPIPDQFLKKVQSMSNHLPINAEAIRAEAIEAERQRISQIQSMLSPWMDRGENGPGIRALFNQALQDTSITSDLVGQKVLAMLAANASPIAGHYVTSEPGDGSGLKTLLSAAEDTLLMRAGLQVNEPHPATKDTNRMSVVAMAERVLSMHGKSVSGMGKNEIISAALSTSDFKQLLANTVGRALRTGYENAPATHAPWTAEREVTDFKKQTLVALSEAPDLRHVPEGGEYEFGSFSDSGSEFAVITHGRIVSLTRQALVNDDLGAFTNLPAAFGAASRRLEADKVYELLTGSVNLADSLPLFHANRGNLAPVAGKLDVANLGLARAQMRKQKGINGQAFIDPQPRFLIVPVALETSAENLIATLTTPGLNQVTPQEVKWISNLTLIADPRLDASSETAWYLAADPKQIEGITRAYLQGEQRPYVEENDEFKRDVISWKVRLDFCAGVVDYRGLFKNTGA